MKTEVEKLEDRIRWAFALTLLVFMTKVQLFGFFG